MTILRCKSCGNGRAATVLVIEYAESYDPNSPAAPPGKYEEQPGGTCDQCGYRMGGADEIEQEFAELIEREHAKLSIAEVADHVADFANHLQDRGLDSLAVASLAQHFAVGNISPNDVTKWRRQR